MHFPYITYGMMLHVYINDSIPVYRQNTYIEKMYVIYASERSERALKNLHFHILILLFPSNHILLVQSDTLFQKHI